MLRAGTEPSNEEFYEFRSLCAARPWSVAEILEVMRFAPPKSWTHCLLLKAMDMTSSATGKSATGSPVCASWTRCPVSVTRAMAWVIRSKSHNEASEVLGRSRRFLQGPRTGCAELNRLRADAIEPPAGWAVCSNPSRPLAGFNPLESTRSC